MPKLAKTLTDVAVRNYKPKETTFKFAAGRGLHLLIKPDGSKFWVFRYRFEGVENSLSMGRYPDVSVAVAEERVRMAHTSIAKGNDPSENRKKDKADKVANKTNTFEVWSKKWWQHWKPSKSPRHARYVMRRFELDMFETLGTLPINEIQAQQVAECVKAIAKRDALDLAKRVHQTIGQVFK